MVEVVAAVVGKVVMGGGAVGVGVGENAQMAGGELGEVEET